jgi:hypothetical protein
MVTTAISSSDHKIDATGSVKEVRNLPRLVRTVGIHRDQEVVCLI